MTSDEVREGFLSFFKGKGHKIIPSSSLIPHGDPSLLLTTAGMVQIKPYFLGLEEPPSPRLVSCQKCFRTTDVDSVGDTSHLTFFEMLGNFSVGDYFKKEAIEWAWEFVTEDLKLSRERLWATIYLDDDEALAHWQRVGIPAEKILRFGDEDNFWGPAGNSGPCGPCSELHYDLGGEFGCGKPECRPNCECGRFSEVWNLVFTQYDQHPDGSRAPLPKPNIDTGMGMERITAAVQGRQSVYETDLFWPVIEGISQLASKKYGASETNDRYVRIIAEHSRGVAFLIADGVLPSNEGRGYVLRRILRRASLFGRRLGLDMPFLGQIAQIAANKMADVYPELVTNRNMIMEVIRAEEDKFIATLETGLDIVEELVEKALKDGKEQLAGEQVFRLYDTYGFPKELTAEIAKERGLTVDVEGFETEMEEQRAKARAGHKFAATPTTETALAVDVEFTGHEASSSQSRVLELRVMGKPKETASQEEKVDIILDVTPFYGAMGGQVGDSGEMTGNRGRVAITDTVRNYSDVTIHQGTVVEGNISVGDAVVARIDVARRLDIARNHTATHLLQAALREILGSHVYQRGSSVQPSRLRFDFSHLATITAGQLDRIQGWVNEKIREDLPVSARSVPYQDAIAEGAIALFEEKYGGTVRVLEIGEPPISKELCGGTHVKSTGEIGILLITSESSIGTGLHRLEAVTGRTAEWLIAQRFSTLQMAAKELECLPEDVSNKAKSLATQLGLERKRSLSLERELSQGIAEYLASQTKKIDGVTVVTAEVASLTMSVLREMGDKLRDRLGSAVVVLATVYDGKPSFLATVTPDLVARGFHAGRIVEQVAKVAGGGGGGKAGMAQAGGKDARKIKQALGLVQDIIADEARQAQ